MVEKEGVDATFCGMGGGWTGLKIFLPNWKIFCLREKKSAGFSFRKQQNLLEKGGRLCYPMKKSIRRILPFGVCAGLAVNGCTGICNICCGSFAARRNWKILFGKPDFI